MAAADGVDLVFIASVSSIRAFNLKRGHQYEASRLNDIKGASGNSETERLFSHSPALVLPLPIGADQINCLKTCSTKIDGSIRELLIAVTDSGTAYIWDISFETDYELTLRRIEKTSPWSIEYANIISLEVYF